MIESIADAYPKAVTIGAALRITRKLATVINELEEPALRESKRNLYYSKNTFFAGGMDE